MSSGVVHDSCFRIIFGTYTTRDNKGRFTHVGYQDANKSFQSVIDDEKCNKTVIKNTLLYDYTCSVYYWLLFIIIIRKSVRFFNCGYRFRPMS